MSASMHFGRIFFGTVTFIVHVELVGEPTGKILPGKCGLRITYFQGSIYLFNESKYNVAIEENVTPNLLHVRYTEFMSSEIKE